MRLLDFLYSRIFKFVAFTGIFVFGALFFAHTSYAYTEINFNHGTNELTDTRSGFFCNTSTGVEDYIWGGASYISSTNFNTSYQATENTGMAINQTYRIVFSATLPDCSALPSTWGADYSEPFYYTASNGNSVQYGDIDAPRVTLDMPDVAGDFDMWHVKWSNSGADTYAKPIIQYSTSSANMLACVTYPYGAGTSDCVPTGFYTDIGTGYYGTDKDTGAQYIFKGTGLEVGTDYYARAVLRDSTGENLLVSNTIEFTIGSPTVLAPIAPTPLSCSTFDLGCYIKQALGWAFIPSADSLNQFTGLTLANSLPFSYIYDMGNIYNDLFANGGSQSYSVGVDDGVFGHISFISASQINAVPYASTIKTILGYLLYFFTAVTLYRIIIKVHDKTTPTT